MGQAATAEISRKMAKLRNVIAQETVHGSRSFELWEGDITNPGFEVDILAVSYIQQRIISRSVAGALASRYGLNMYELLEKRYVEVDLRQAFSIWLSKELPQTHGIPFRRILAIDMSEWLNEEEEEIFDNIFAALSMLDAKRIPCRTISLPIFGAGGLGCEPNRMLEKLLPRSIAYLEKSPSTQKIALFAYEPHTAEALDNGMKRVLGRTSTNAPKKNMTPKPPPSMWCVTYRQLMELEKHALETFGKDEYPSKTMRDICKEIIEPICSKTETSYALSLNKEGIPVDTFISHSWDGCFADFVRSIRNAFQTVVRKPNLWICAFALVQGQDHELISQQLGSGSDPLDESPFVRAIQAATAFCVVRNSNMDVYSRIWCVCELMYAKQHNLYPEKTHVTGPDMFAHLQTSVLDAQATRLQDRDRILRVLLNEFDREEIDSFVHQLRTQDEPQD
jgi:hypothetical protein